MNAICFLGSLIKYSRSSLCLVDIAVNTKDRFCFCRSLIDTKAIDFVFCGNGSIQKTVSVSCGRLIDTKAINFGFCGIGSVQKVGSVFLLCDSIDMTGRESECLLITSSNFKCRCKMFTSLFLTL